MPYICAVRSCSSRNSKVPMHKVPISDDLRQKWEKYLYDHGSTKIPNHFCICFKHFETIDGKRLKYPTVPASEWAISHGHGNDDLNGDLIGKIFKLQENFMFNSQELSGVDLSGDLLQEMKVEGIMEGMGNPEPKLSPGSLMISDVYSEARANAKPESSYKSISVKTPGQLNGSIKIKEEEESPRDPVFVKRLGNTTIRHTRVSDALKTQLSKMISDASPNVQLRKSSPIPMKRQVTASPVVTQGANHFMPQRDHKDIYIEKLTQQNEALKKALNVCRQEVVVIHNKLRNVNMTLDEVFYSINSATSLPPYPSPGTPQPRVTARKSTSCPVVVPVVKTSTPITSNSYRVPVFPIKFSKTLDQFDKDLENHKFFELVSQRISQQFRQTCQGIKIPGSLLKFVLHSIITPDLLGSFSYDAKSRNPDNFHLRSFKSYYNFIAFFSRVVNSLCAEIFRKRMNPNVFEPFLRNEITRQQDYKRKRVENHRMEAQEQLNSLQYPESVIEPVIEIETKTDDESKPEEHPVENSRSEDDARVEEEAKTDGDDPSKEIHWIEDNSEMGTEILGDESQDVPQIEDDEEIPEQNEEEANGIENENDEEENGDEEMEEGNDDGSEESPQLESIMEEQDFQFID